MEECGTSTARREELSQKLSRESESDSCTRDDKVRNARALREREFVANRIVSVESGVNGPTRQSVKAMKSVAHDSQ